jgi:hypothetical protein
MNRNTNNQNNTNDRIVNGITQMITNAGTWHGTMTQLNRELGRKSKRPAVKSPYTLRIVLNRVVNRLRARGISVRFGRANDRIRTRFVKFAI